MIDVVWENYKQRVKLWLSDRLYDEPLVVAEEKETATLTCAFTSVKYLLTIVCRQQACLNYTNIDVEKIVYLHELNILV